MADIKAAVVRDTLPQTTGTFTVTIPGSPGWTPKACIVFASNASSDDSEDDDAAISIGFSDGTRERVVQGYTLHNTANTQNRRVMDADAVCWIRPQSGSVIEVSAITGTGVGPTTDGWVFNVEQENTTVERYATFIFLGGTDLSAHCNTFTPDPDENDPASETGLSFEPDLVLFAGSGLAITDAPTLDSILSFGAAWNDTTPVNVGIAYAHEWDASVSDLGSMVYSDRVGGQVLETGETWAGEVTSFASNGYTMHTRDGRTSDDDLIALSLNLGGGDVWVGNMDTPTSSASDWNPTNPSFEPLLGILAFTSRTTIDVFANVNSVVALGATDGTRFSSVAMNSEDNVTTMDEGSIAAADTLKFLDPSDGSVMFEAANSTLDSNGFTVPSAQLITVDATARKGFGIFIGDAAGGGATLTPTAIASAEAFGTPTIAPGGVTGTPSSIASAEAFGTPTLETGETLVPDAIASAEAFGTPTIAPGVLTITPTSIASAEAFGTVTVAPGQVIVAPSSIASAEAFGTPTLVPGTVTLTPTAIVSGEAFGTPTVEISGVITPLSIASAEAFGSHTVSPGTVTIVPTAIPSGEAFGTPTLALVYAITPDAIPSGEAFGTVALQLGALTITPDGIASAEAFGTAEISIVGGSITNQQIYDKLCIVENLLRGRYDTDPVTGLAKIYDEDGVTVIYQANIYQDVDGAIPYNGANGIQRRDRFEEP